MFGHHSSSGPNGRLTVLAAVALGGLLTLLDGTVARAQQPGLNLRLKSADRGSQRIRTQGGATEGRRQSAGLSRAQRQGPTSREACPGLQGRMGSRTIARSGNRSFLESSGRLSNRRGRDGSRIRPSLAGSSLGDLPRITRSVPGTGSRADLRHRQPHSPAVRARQAASGFRSPGSLNAGSSSGSSTSCGRNRAVRASNQ